MPGTRCAVSVCNNSLVVTKKKNLDITYHTFPKHEQTFEKWVKACCRKDKWNPKTSVVCSEHFREDDFVTDLKAKLLNTKAKRKLQPSAVPSLLLTPKHKKNDIKASFKKKVIRKKNQKIMAPETFTSDGESNVEPNPLTVVETLDEDMQTVDVLSVQRIEELIYEHETLKMDHKALQDSFEKQKKELESTQKLLASVAAKLENETQRRQQLEETLSKVLNTSQQVVVVVKKKGDDK